MHSRTEEVLRYLDTNRAALEQALDAVPATLRERRPAADRWSAAEIIEHLAVVEGRVTGVVEEHLAAAPDLGPDPETSPVLPMLDVERFLDRSQPLVASEASQPRQGLSAGDAWELLSERRRQLRDRILASDGLALGELKVEHARLGELNLYQWLLFLGAHEARHTAQLREVATSHAAS